MIRMGVPHGALKLGRDEGSNNLLCRLESGVCRVGRSLQWVLNV